MLQWTFLEWLFRFARLFELKNHNSPNIFIPVDFITWRLLSSLFLNFCYTTYLGVFKYKVSFPSKRQNRHTRLIFRINFKIPIPKYSWYQNLHYSCALQSLCIKDTSEHLFNTAIALQRLLFNVHGDYLHMQLRDSLKIVFRKLCGNTYFLRIDLTSQN